MTLCQTAHLSKTYPRAHETIHALDDVSLTVAPGEVVAVHGPSGCGKTTLLLALGGLLQPDAGEVLLDDQPLYDLPLRARASLRARVIGFVFQQYHLIPFLTVRENILSPTLAQPIADAVARADALLAQFGLDARRDHHPADLSTGERQRTALARALFARPKLLLADEPTGNLDTPNANVVLDAFRAFADEGGGVLLVTHDARTAPAVSRVITMTEGRFVQSA